MEAFGILVLACAGLLLLGGVLIAARSTAGDPNRLERVYVLASWCTLPFVIPVVLLRLLTPPVLHLPVALTLAALIRAMLGVPLVLIGAAWIVRSLVVKRPIPALLLATIANILSYVPLILPQP